MDPQTPLKESMLALAQAVQSGKALYVGLSNYDGPTMERAYEILDDLHVPYVINQNCYNLLDRSIEENGLLAMSRQKKVGVISFSPLAKGQLTNRYLDGIPADSRVARDSRFLKASDLTEQKLAGLRKLNDLAAESGHSLAQLALKWNLQQEGISSVLIGASKPDQILDNVAALNSSELSAVVIQQMEMIASGLKK